MKSKQTCLDFQFYNVMLAICIGNYFKTIENIKKVSHYVPKNNRHNQ